MLNVISLGQIKTDSIDQMIVIAVDFYLEIFKKWDPWNLPTVSGDKINLNFNMQPLLYIIFQEICVTKGYLVLSWTEILFCQRGFLFKLNTEWRDVKTNVCYIELELES